MPFLSSSDRFSNLHYCVGKYTKNLPHRNGYDRRFDVIYENRISSMKEMRESHF